MIPKTIHYCWFGRNPLPESAVKCIDSWRKFFPDYEIKEWNEDNFDVYSIPYTAEAYQVPAVLAFNKIDLLDTDEWRSRLDELRTMYESIGYPVITMSAATGEGADALRAQLAGKMSLLSGNSGVGKSSIINLLVPDAHVRVGDVSHTHHKGMHTTTFSELLDLPGGGAIIDTPGVKAFGTIDFERAEVAHYFPEIFRISDNCRFNNCTHTHEPGCAVLEAVEQGKIAPSRFTSYLSILEEDPNNKYRKPF